MKPDPRVFEPSAPLDLTSDPIAQWLDWEEQANLVGFRASTAPVAVDVVHVEPGQLEVHVLPGAPASIVERFVRADHVCFPRHPLNRDASVAFSERSPHEVWQARFTSSRTLALPGPESGEALASLKLATDHPHPDFLQPEKTRLRDEAQSAVEWVSMIRRIDGLLCDLDRVELIAEALVVMVAGSETGYLVRDLRLFQDGRYYLPALSIPWVGPQIANRLGESFAELFGTAFASAAGRAKAQLLARYGLWYETPNPQNLLVQLGADLRPTGTIVLRDIGDGYCATDAPAQTDVPWSVFQTELRLETQNSFWAFGEAGDHSVDADTLATWYARHDAAYFAELAAWFPELAPRGSLPLDAHTAHWNQSLRSDRAKGAVERGFAARLR